MMNKKLSPYLLFGVLGLYFSGCTTNCPPASRVRLSGEIQEFDRYKVYYFTIGCDQTEAPNFRNFSDYVDKETGRFHFSDWTVGILKENCFEIRTPEKLINKYEIVGRDGEAARLIDGNGRKFKGIIIKDAILIDSLEIEQIRPASDSTKQDDQ